MEPSKVVKEYKDDLAKSQDENEMLMKLYSTQRSTGPNHLLHFIIHFYTIWGYRHGRVFIMRLFLVLTILSSFLASNVFARPISYSGGTTMMQTNGAIKNSLHIHYSPSYKYSVGYKGEYFREDQITLNGLQLNNLVKRWNLPAAQGNLYLKSSIGHANKSGENELYGFAGVAGDFETRKYFISYENRYYKSDGDILSNFEQSARIGIAPYVAGYGSLHTWLMLQASHQPEIEGDEVIATPLIRFFKGANLAEFGVSSNKKILFNFIARF